MSDQWKVRLPNVKRDRNAKSRIWFCQPNLRLTETAPFVRVRTDGYATGMEILKNVVSLEGKQPNPADAPTVILAPELCIHPSEVEELRALALSARENTVIIAGAGQLTETEAKRIENADLWTGASEGLFTNCALIACGGSSQLYLQPKIVASAAERSTHWPGRFMRLFEGSNFAFGVAICSEFLDRPEPSIQAFVKALQSENKSLAAVFWIQHNQKPRSKEFLHSLSAFEEVAPTPTVVICGSRADRPKRFEHFAVSGAIVSRALMPSQFRFLAGRFHYVEPVPSSSGQLSRLVLLRYDADAILTETVYADALKPASKTQKAAFFEHQFHYALTAGSLQPSSSHVHIDDLLALVFSHANQFVTDASVTMARPIGELGADQLLAVLDIAILPQPKVVADQHCAGEEHKGGDAECTCWLHRECVDLLTTDNKTASQIGEVFAAYAALSSAGLDATVAYDPACRSNGSIRLDGERLPTAIVHPLDLNADEAEARLDLQRLRLSHPALYVVLGVPGRPYRPRLATVDAGRATPRGSVNASILSKPAPRVIFQPDFWKAYEAKKLEELIRATI